MKLRRGRRVVLSTLLMVAGASCGGDGDGGGAGDGDGDEKGLAAREFLPELASVLCDAFEECAGPLAAAFFKGGDCRADFTRQFEDETGDLDALIADGRVHYDAEGAADCLDMLRAAGCGVFGGDLLSGCEAAVDGTVAVGDDCNIDAECEGDSYCKEDAQCPGSCTRHAKAGESCLDTECKDGTFCDADGKCKAEPGAGGSCGGNTDVDCKFGFVCAGADQPTTGTPGTCKTIDEVFTGSEGDDCDLATTKLCKAGLSCAVVEATQTSWVTKCTKPVASKADCRLAIPDQCPADEQCHAIEGAIEGTCRRYREEGEACASDPCGSDLACVGNGDALVCQPMKRLGDACAADEQCYSGSCERARCVSGLGCSL